MSSYFLFLLATILQLALLAEATDLLGGHTGRVGLAPVLFLGIGAYSYALFTIRFGWNPWLAIILTCLLVLVVSVCVGHLLLKLDADGYLIGTFAMQVAFVNLANNLNLTGGSLGIRDIRGPALLRFGDESTIGALWVLVPAAVIATVLLVRVFGRTTPLGRLYHWIRDDRLSASVFGVRCGELLLAAFVLHALIAGVAGIGMAVAQSYIAPQSFDLGLSLSVLTAVFLGGSAGSPFAMVLGAVLFVAATEFVSALPLAPEMVGAFQQVMLNGLLVVILVFRQRGVAGPIVETGPSASRSQ